MRFYLVFALSKIAKNQYFNQFWTFKSVRKMNSWFFKVILGRYQTFKVPSSAVKFGLGGEIESYKNVEICKTQFHPESQCLNIFLLWIKCFEINKKKSFYSNTFFPLSTNPNKVCKYMRVSQKLPSPSPFFCDARLTPSRHARARPNPWRQKFTTFPQICFPGEASSRNKKKTGRSTSRKRVVMGGWAVRSNRAKTPSPSRFPPTWTTLHD